MTTTIDEHGICHIDGPPTWGFAIAENSDGSGNRVEVIYRLLVYHGTKQECEDAQRSLLNLVTSELQDLAKIQLNPRLVRPIIWWRRRPELIQDDDGRFKDHWKFSARFDTTPKLPDTFWQKWECKDGHPARPASEVTHG